MRGIASHPSVWQTRGACVAAPTFTLSSLALGTLFAVHLGCVYRRDASLDAERQTRAWYRMLINMTTKGGGGGGRRRRRRRLVPASSLLAATLVR